MTTYWLMGEKPTNNNVQQANPTTFSQISTLQDQPPAVTAQIQMTQPKQVEQRALPPTGQHKFQGQSDQQYPAQQQQSIQSRSQELRQQGHPGQQRPQESQHSGLTGQPRGQGPAQVNPSSVAPNQLQQKTAMAMNPACGLAMTGNGAPKSTIASRTVVGNSSPSRNRSSVSSNANNSVHQVYPTAESMPNHTESGPNAPLLLPAGAIPRV